MNIKPIILLDCDGVLADFTSLALNFIEEETGKVISNEDIPRWDIFESLGHPELWNQFEKKLEDRGLCSRIKPYSSALEVVKKLRLRYEVLIVTAPIDALPWMYERAHWIEDVFGIPRKKVIFASEKQYIRGDVFVDDKPENVIDWAKSNPNGIAILWEHPYNRNCFLPDGILRISNWNVLLRTLEKKFDK